MRAFPLIFLFVLTTCFSPNKNFLETGPRIWVAVQELREELTVTSEGDVSLFDLNQREIGKLPADQPIHIEKSGNLLKINGATYSKGVYLKLNRPGALWSIDGRSYLGHLRIVPNKKTWLVLDCLLEDYVAGVVACESAFHFHQEALKAQAVCSRTFAWLRKKYERRQPGNYDLYATSRDQVFKGVDPINWRHRRAAKETKDIVLMFNRKLLPAFYHSTCGGQTQNSARVGLTKKEMKPLKGVSCNLCQKSRFWRWQTEIAFDDYSKIFDLPESPQSIEVQKDSGGQVLSLSFVMKREKKEVSGGDFRKLMGFRRIKSLRFGCSLNDDKSLVIQGRGWGHGVGLCQWGANELAQKGYRWQRILDHYYPSSSLTKIGHVFSS